MSSENTDSCDDSQVKDVKEEGEKEVDNDSSADVSIDGGRRREHDIRDMEIERSVFV